MFQTPESLNGVQIDVDAFQPRKQAKDLIAAGRLRTDDESKNFSQKFIVDEALARKYVEHVKVLETNKRKRAEKKRLMAQLEKDRRYDEYDWISLFNDGLLKKLTVADLNKYLLHNKMVHCLKLKKAEKVRIIQGHIVSTSNNEANFEEWEDGQDDVSSISSNDSDYDIVLCDTNMSDDQQSSDDSGDNVENIFTKTRSGRIVTNWRISKHT